MCRLSGNFIRIPPRFGFKPTSSIPVVSYGLVGDDGPWWGTSTGCLGNGAFSVATVTMAAVVLVRPGWVLGCLFGQGGGLRWVVVRAGVYLLPLDQYRFQFGFLLGQGGGCGLA